MTRQACGHWVRRRGCGGCDPLAVDHVVTASGRRCPCVLHAFASAPTWGIACICECDHEPDERRWSLRAGCNVCGGSGLIYDALGGSDLCGNCTTTDPCCDEGMTCLECDPDATFADIYANAPFRPDGGER